MFLHDIIKVDYVNQGYLPNYPYHLITDKEMFDAFLSDDGYFADNYPCLDDSLSEQYAAFRQDIVSRINDYLENSTAIPSWIYSYMLGASISVNSDVRDLRDLYTLTGLEYTSAVPEFTAELSAECYAISSAWLKKQTAADAQRTPTLFGEPHVIKSLRLSGVDILSP